MPGGAQYFSLLDLKDACSLSPFIQTLVPAFERRELDTLEALGQCFPGAFWRAPMSLLVY